jgi:three-Cys-motif partner protein
LLRRSESKSPRECTNLMHSDLVQSLLTSGTIKQTEATFCLLDQRTFECRWSTLEALARYKTDGHKIELFYFLPNSWFDRAVAAQRDHHVLHTWWEGDGWEGWLKQKPSKRLEVFVERFRQELGYQSVKPWPIYERSDGGKTMYYVIHATDHPAAPELMSRAYARAIGPKESIEQLSLEFASLPSLP